MKSRRAYLVAGASGTIGSAVAEALAASDVSLGLHYRTNSGGASALQARISERGTPCELLQSDLANERDCRDLVERFRSRFDTVSGVALCAGSVPWRAWRELDTDAWQQVFFEHCIAPVTIAGAAIQLMSDGGRIVFLSSISPKYGGSSKTLHYAAAKAALEAAMRGLARESASAGIRVNGVRAGFVDTPQQRHGRSAQELAERVAKIPVGRAGTAHEIASAIAYLMSERAGFISGELITVAGGD